MLPEPVQPADWPAPRGYSNGVRARGTTVAVAGQVGWDPLTGGFSSDDFTAQCAQALRNVAAVLAAAGALPRHTIRLTWYITSAAEYAAAGKALGAAYRSVFGDHYPAMSVVVVAGLLEPRAKIEIEATAVLPEGVDG